MRNVEYSLLAMMSELSTCGVIACLVFEVQVHGRRASTEVAVEELGRAVAPASTPGLKAQATVGDGFLGLAPQNQGGGRRRQVVEVRASVSGLTEVTGVPGV
jgi:hypothetical protein